MSDKTARVFIDDDSGEGLQLIGSAGDVGMLIINVGAYTQVAIDTLLAGADGDVVTLTLTRKDMTSYQVATLPEF